MGVVCTSKIHLGGVEGGFGLSRYRWQTPGGGAPSVGQANMALANLPAIYDALTALTPSTVVVTADPVIDLTDEATGLLTGVVTATVLPAFLANVAVNPYVSGTGGKIEWRTGVRRRSREVRGANFIVPLDSLAFAASGDLLGSTVVTLSNAAGSYLFGMGGSGLIAGVYGRPHAASIHYPAEGGLFAPVSSQFVTSTPAFLRRRRT